MKREMWPSETNMLVAGWVCALLAAVSADSGGSVYKKAGDDVILKPGVFSQPIINILWKHNSDIAAQWDRQDEDPDFYRQFKVKGSLNLMSGELTITELTEDDRGEYTAEINNNVASSTRLLIISPVSEPSVKKSCNMESTSCVLTCEGATPSSEPVTYKWNSGGVQKEKNITKKEDASEKEFICELQNPISQQSSQPILNPFFGAPIILEPEPEKGIVNISSGVTVFICLLSAVLLLVFIHRCKAGMWFYQKASMPWEADFWRKNERPSPDAAGLNGNSSHQDKRQTAEDTPMA